MKSKKLKTEFVKDKFQFKQIKRGDSAAVYEKSKEGQSPVYETILIKHQKKDHAFPAGKDGTPGVVVEAGTELYPSNGDWGVYGFSYPDMDSALEKYRELENRPKKDG